jgi:general secretion pathway protein A
MATNPFNLSPDPKYLYLTPQLQTAIHKLNYVIERRQGASVVLGDLGLGKSSLLRLVLRDYVTRDDYRLAYIPTPNFKSDYAFLKAICRELRLPPRRSLLDQQEELQHFCLDELEAGRNVLLLLDEGQKLDNRMLEVLRTLLNYETDDAKSLQVIVAGQLEMQERLSDPKNRALKSRIFAPTILSPLSLDETREMIAFRCNLAGERSPFDDGAVGAIYERTGGIPREVIAVCQMAWNLRELTAADEVTAAFVEPAATEARLP